jgi:hypothetical protein
VTSRERSLVEDAYDALTAGDVEYAAELIVIALDDRPIRGDTRCKTCLPPLARRTVDMPERAELRAARRGRMSWRHLIRCDRCGLELEPEGLDPAGWMSFGVEETHACRRVSRSRTSPSA